MWNFAEAFLELIAALITIQDGHDWWRKKSKGGEKPPSDTSTLPSSPSHNPSPLVPLEPVPEIIHLSLEQDEIVHATAANDKGDFIAVTQARALVSRGCTEGSASLTAVPISSLTRLEGKTGSSGYSLILAANTGVQVAFTVSHIRSQSLLKVAGCIRMIQNGQLPLIPQTLPKSEETRSLEPHVVQPSPLSPPPFSPQITRAESPHLPISENALTVGGPISDEGVIRLVAQILLPDEHIRATVAGSESTSFLLTTFRLLTVATRLIGEPQIKSVAFDEIRNIISSPSHLTLLVKDGAHISIHVSTKYYNQLNEFAARLRTKTQRCQGKAPAA